MKFKQFLKHTIAVILIVFSLIIQVPSPVLAATQSADDILFKQLTDQSYAAWNTHNPDAVAAFYLNDPELVVYDATPLKYQGW